MRSHKKTNSLHQTLRAFQLSSCCPPQPAFVVQQLQEPANLPCPARERPRVELRGANCNQAPRARANPFPQGSGLLWLDETRRQQAAQPFISSVLTCSVHAPKLLNERLLPQKPGGAVSQQNPLHPFSVTPASLGSLPCCGKKQQSKHEANAVNPRAGPCRPHALRGEGAWGGKAALVPPQNPALAAVTCQGKVTCLCTWEDICGSFYLSYNVSKLNFWLTARQTKE